MQCSNSITLFSKRNRIAHYTGALRTAVWRDTIQFIMCAQLINDKKDLHLSVHIERTAGTSLLVEYIRFYGPERTLIYQPQTDRLIRVSNSPISPANPLLHYARRVLEWTPFLRFIYKWYLKIASGDRGFLNWIEPEDLPADAAVIHGHFSPLRFDGLIENPFTTVVLREPLDRMVSHYLHWKRAGGNVGWRVEIPFDKRISFEEFCFRQPMKNFQTKVLAGKPLENFDLVGVTRGLEGFLAQLRGEDYVNQHDIPEIHGVVSKPKYSKLGITEAFIERFEAYNALDYKNYHLAKRLAAKKRPQRLNQLEA